MYPRFKPDVEKIRNQRRATGPSVTKGRTVWWWLRPFKDLPRFVRFGLCIVCGKIAIRLSGGREAPKFHKRCYHEWMRTPEGQRVKSLWRRGQEASTPQPQLRLRVKAPVGMSGTENSLRISFSCAVQYYLAGKSDQTIADENSIGRASVNDRIKFVIENLPDPDLLFPRFQRIARLLLDAAKQRSRRSVVVLNR
ncbi:MAG: hypothetical protein HY694_00930 [Deltaproteobacteria bacterium]|nr:hypothetical protein [Deltaproteobacteria bacterium]